MEQVFLCDIEENNVILMKQIIWSRFSTQQYYWTNKKYDSFGLGSKNVSVKFEGKETRRTNAITTAMVSATNKGQRHTFLFQI
jgi:hypothetical protein